MDKGNKCVLCGIDVMCVDAIDGDMKMQNIREMSVDHVFVRGVFRDQWGINVDDSSSLVIVFSANSENKVQLRGEVNSLLWLLRHISDIGLSWNIVHCRLWLLLVLRSVVLGPLGFVVVYHFALGSGCAP